MKIPEKVADNNLHNGFLRHPMLYLSTNTTQACVSLKAFLMKVNNGQCHLILSSLEEDTAIQTKGQQ